MNKPLREKMPKRFARAAELNLEMSRGDLWFLDMTDDELRKNSVKITDDQWEDICSLAKELEGEEWVIDLNSACVVVRP